MREVKNLLPGDRIGHKKLLVLGAVPWWTRRTVNGTLVYKQYTQSIVK